MRSRVFKRSSTQCAHNPVLYNITIDSGFFVRKEKVVCSARKRLSDRIMPGSQQMPLRKKFWLSAQSSGAGGAKGPYP